ncbi:TPA: restriction endonuclease subunit S, partial [Campylobacter upsaliensis]|nr:restriction endonuclease subunit S [Campylobacter upsaliensis]
VSIKKCGNEQQLCATQSYGVIPKKLYSYKTVEVISSDLNSFKLVKKDNFVISLRSFEGGIEHSNYQGIISPAYTILEPQVEIYSFYFKFLFKSSFFISTLNIHKIGIREGQNISYASLQYTPIPLPPLQEQKEIAEFLDKKCEKIQNYINKKQKLITLLQEKKQALINEVVTKGLNPNIESKNSGIEWLGEIPKHWEVKKIKYIYKSINGFTPDTSNASYYDNFNGYDWITISDINKKYVNESEVKVSQKYIDKFHPQVTPKGSLLYSFKLSVGLVAFAKKDIYTNEAVLSFLNTNDVDLNFLYYSSFLIQFNAKENIYGAKLLNKELINNAFMVFPPLQEQKEIAEFLDKKCEKINSVIEKTKKQIELIKEYKNTLINEAVCGRINLERK